MQSTEIKFTLQEMETAGGRGVMVAVEVKGSISDVVASTGAIFQHLTGMVLEQHGQDPDRVHAVIVAAMQGKSPLRTEETTVKFLINEQYVSAPKVEGDVDLVTVSVPGIEDALKKTIITATMQGVKHGDNKSDFYN